MANSKLRTALLTGSTVAIVGTGAWALQRDSASRGVLIETPTPLATAVPAPTPTVASILVHVAGEVREPGVYALPAGARVQDAIQAAGGLSEQADLDRVNLADHVQDAMRLHIPCIGEATPLPPTAISGDSRANTLHGMGSRININTASQAELESLPHIGEAMAARIIAYREAHGPFERIEAITEVSGIGEQTLADLRELITVE